MLAKKALNNNTRFFLYYQKAYPQIKIHEKRNKLKYIKNNILNLKVTVK